MQPSPTYPRAALLPALMLRGNVGKVLPSFVGTDCDPARTISAYRETNVWVKNETRKITVYLYVFEYN